MVRNYTVALVCTAAVLVCGCQKEEQSPALSGHIITLQANAVGTGSTKIVFDTDGNSWWLPGDAIGVTTEGAQTLSKLTLDSSTEYKQEGKFTGEVTGTVGTWAIYPYNANHQISGTALTYNLPATYKYSSVDQNYTVAPTSGTVSATYYNSANAPAYGTVKTNDDGTFSAKFSHLCGVLCLKVEKLPASTGYITLTADRKITGNFTVDLSKDTPELTSNAASSSENTVTISYEGGVANGSGVFYIPMPVGDYNVTVEVGYTTPAKGKMASITPSHKVTITRKEIHKVCMNYTTMAKNGHYILRGHGFVDMGLSSGLLWAETNVGADDCTGYGNYYMWSEYRTATAAWTDITGLDVPSQPQFQELIDACSQKITSVNGVVGKLFTSNNNGNTLFFPAAGYKINIGEYDEFHGGYGEYWTNTDAGQDDQKKWRAYCYEYKTDGSWTELKAEEQTDKYSIRLIAPKQ
jgi:uncharacterized protein (TIGR02145 family)